MRTTLASLLIICLTGIAVWAQSTAQISGTVKDASGGVLPGVTVKATQTATGLERETLTNETGSYVLPNLPVGAYRLEAGLPGFRSFVQTGIVLQVDANPVLNIGLEVGQVTESIEVQADAALVETRTTGVGQVIDNTRVMELPLNGRQVTELIILSGAAVGGGLQNSPRNYPIDIISVGGGSNDGLTFMLDGAIHNDPYGNQGLPLPFPDALQEFKVETNAVPAQYGYHAAGAVNVVTKSGSNQFHGSLFEFVRNRIFNARNPFATERDALKRNQFGGVVGGPIIENKLFFFGGLQTTLLRAVPQGNTAFVPTPQMMAGDWTTYASAVCQPRAVTLQGPFVNNRIDPAVYSKPAVEVIQKLNAAPIDACGRVLFSRRQNTNEYLPVTKVDYQPSTKQSIFGRYEMARLDQPTDYDGRTLLSINNPDSYKRVKSFVLGQTYSISPAMVSSLRGSVLRSTNVKTSVDYFTWGDLGVKNLYYPPDFPKLALLSVTGAFSLFGTTGAPGITNSTLASFGEDLTYVRGAHQIGFGAIYAHEMMNYTSSTNAAGNFMFTGAVTGTGISDFLTGKPISFTQSRITTEYYSQNYVAAYLQDTWKATSHFTVNAGVRWEPYRSPYDRSGKGAFFDKTRFDQGIVSRIFPNAPAGIYFQGENGIPDTNAWQANNWKRFAPRLGLAWDPKGDGLTVVRAAYGIFFDFPHMHQYGGRRDTPPRGVSIAVNTPSLDDPWASVAGGNPFPIVLGKTTPFPLSGGYAVFPWNLKKPYINQWNLSVQHQVGQNWLLSANYLGSSIIHMFYRYEANPGVYLPGASCVLAGKTYSPCSTLGNTNQRRLLSLQNQAVGQYFSNIIVGDDGNTRTYGGLILSVQRRRAKGVTVQGNYTVSHCIDDGYNDVIQTSGVVSGGQIQSRRRANRGNCELDRRQNLNMSTVYETPQFANRTLHVLGSGWQLSGIVHALSGPYFSVGSGTDIAFSGTPTSGGNLGVDQRPNQILASPYMPNKGVNGWLNPAAFALPAAGNYGNLGSRNILGPASIRFDVGLTRSFSIREKQSLQVRAEAFNISNHPNYCAPPMQGVSSGNACPDNTLNSPTFGKILNSSDPRIMQVALKYVF